MYNSTCGPGGDVMRNSVCQSTTPPVTRFPPVTYPTSTVAPNTYPQGKHFEKEINNLKIFSLTVSLSLSFSQSLSLSISLSLSFSFSFLRMKYILNTPLKNISQLIQFYAIMKNFKTPNPKVNIWKKKLTI